MQSAYISHAQCALHEMGDAHPECPQRLTAIHDHLIAKGILDHMHCVEAPTVQLEHLYQAHTKDYVDGLLAMAPEAGYLQIDPDTRMNSFTMQAALRAAGAAVLATDMVLRNEVSSAFCSIRPPGHHALSNQAMGFCFFNNVAVGIRHALSHYHLQRVALIDFDVHHGNGSEQIFQDDPRVLMCSIFERNLYPFCGDQPLGPNMVNIGLPSRSGGDQFRAAVTDHWLPALEKFQPQIIFISAGFDAHREDDLGNLALVEQDYAWVTQQLLLVAKRHCDGKIVSCLEGGYALNALARSVAAHLKVLISE